MMLFACLTISNHLIYEILGLLYDIWATIPKAGAQLAPIYSVGAPILRVIGDPWTPLTYSISQIPCPE